MSNQPPMAPPPGPGQEDELPPWRQERSARGWADEADEPEDFEPFDDTAFREHTLPREQDYYPGLPDDDVHVPYEQPARETSESAADVRAQEDRAATAAPRQDSVRGWHGQNTHKVGLWGSQGSGKTTYLAALRHALGTANSMNGSWNIYPLNDSSAELLINFTTALVSERRFPQATLPGALVPLQWLFVGELANSRFAQRRSLFRRRTSIESRFVLDLIDVSGLAFGDKEEAAPNVVTEALDHLADAQGLIYLFDPVREKEDRDASQYVNRTVTELAKRFAHKGERYLPHHVSVCITKFDHPQVFQQARQAGLVNYGADGLPRVLDEHAETFFDLLCEGNFWEDRDEQGEASAQFIRNALRANFHPDRVRYFVTSSIGFWQPPGWSGNTDKFDPEFFANVNEVDHGIQRIKGPIHPINVLEPLIFLHQRLTRAGLSR